MPTGASILYNLIQRNITNSHRHSTNFVCFHIVARVCKTVSSDLHAAFNSIFTGIFMPSTSTPTSTADIHSLDAACQRRHYTGLANAHEA